MNIEEIKNSGLLERYVLGDISEEEKRFVESALAQSTSLREDLKNLEQTIYALSKENAVNPPDGTKEKIFEKIEQLSHQHQSDQSVEYSKPYTFWKRISILAAVISSFVLLTAGYLYDQKNALEQQVAEISRQYVDLSTQCESLRRSQDITEPIFALFKNPQTQIINLKSVNLDEQAFVLWNKEKKNGLFKFNSFKNLPNNQVYQLWADIDGEMVSLGVLNDISEVQEIPYMDNAESLNITIEPQGGSKHPTIERLVATASV